VNSSPWAWGVGVGVGCFWVVVGESQPFIRFSSRAFERENKTKDTLRSAGRSLKINKIKAVPHVSWGWREKA